MTENDEYKCGDEVTVTLPVTIRSIHPDGRCEVEFENGEYRNNTFGVTFRVEPDHIEND